MNEWTELQLKPAATGRGEVIAVLSLNRPQAANALSGEMIAELTSHLRQVATNPDCRALVLRGKGKHFCAGADLAWMQAAAKLDYAGNLRDAKQLTDLFEALATLPMPTLAYVQGSAYGGAVGLAACCDIVLASEQARFCLSEVKLGLMPAVILPYLARRMPSGQLSRLSLSGRVFSGSEAYSYGLVQRVVSAEGGPAALHDELTALMQGSLAAQVALKKLHAQIVASSLAQSGDTAAGIAALRVSSSGQAGLAAFFAKTSPPWAIALDPSWSQPLD